ncbi:MAG: hypothetical protein U0804_13475 [Gemmataceae bacterium]
MQAAVYAQTDPSADAGLRAELARVQSALRGAAADVPLAPVPVAPPPPRPPVGRLLGPETTGLKVEPTLNLNPVPTAIYPLLDPDTDPLLTVAVTNVSLDAKSKRVCVRAWVEGLSAEAVRTIELKRGVKEPTVLKLLPLLFPERVSRVTTAQRATLHLRVDDLDGRPECHDTFPLVLLARTCGFNAVRDAATGEAKDLTRYYGAWVTPHDDAVQERVRRAAALHPAGMLAGYVHGGPDRVREQVAALYRSLQEAGLAYINAVTDYGAPADSVTQRARLPRESLARKSANCLDGAVLFASLIEGASLSPALLLIPGHALVGWESDDGAGDWQFLETTMVGSADFDAACRSGQRQYEEACEFAPDDVRVHRVADLRARGVWPME